MRCVCPMQGNLGSHPSRLSRFRNRSLRHHGLASCTHYESRRGPGSRPDLSHLSLLTGISEAPFSSLGAVSVAPMPSEGELCHSGLGTVVSLHPRGPPPCALQHNCLGLWPVD